MRPTIACDARRAAGCSPTAPFRDCYATTGRASFMNSRPSGSGGDAAARFFGLMLLLLEGLSHRVHELAVISEGAHVEFIKKSKRRAHQPLIQLLCGVGVLNAETATTQKGVSTVRVPTLYGAQHYL